MAALQNLFERQLRVDCWLKRTTAGEEPSAPRADVPNLALRNDRSRWQQSLGIKARTTATGRFVTVADRPEAVIRNLEKAKPIA